MKFLIYFFAFALISTAVLAASQERFDGNVTLDWKNQYEFDVRVGDTSREFDCRDINASAYNDQDRTWTFYYWYDLSRIQGCTSNEIANITKTVDGLIDQCVNYQRYLNDTTTYAAKYAEWMAAHARCSEKLTAEEDRRKSAENSSGACASSLEGCQRDKETYMRQSNEAENRANICAADLKKATESYGSKYLIGAVLGGVAVYLFTRKKNDVAQESEEFDIVD